MENYDSVQLSLAGGDTVWLGTEKNLIKSEAGVRLEDLRCNTKEFGFDVSKREFYY